MLCFTLDRDYFLNIKKLSCANCSSNTQIHNLREKDQDFLFGEFKNELKAKLAEMGLEVTVLTESFIYGQPLDFEELIEKIRSLKEHFRAINR